MLLAQGIIYSYVSYAGMILENIITIPLVCRSIFYSPSLLATPTLLLEVNAEGPFLIPLRRAKKAVQPRGTFFLKILMTE